LKGSGSSAKLRNIISKCWRGAISSILDWRKKRRSIMFETLSLRPYKFYSEILADTNFKNKSSQTVERLIRLLTTRAVCYSTLDG